MVTRLEHVNPALNIFNIYGQTETRAGGPDKILESWGRIKLELARIEARGEAVLILGDLNRAVGCDVLGVAGNASKVSYGGHLVRDLVASEEYFLLNNLEQAEGGPWTREDPADGGLSCLDLAIGSRNLLPFVQSVKIDCKKQFTPKRVIYVGGRMKTIFTDHFSLLVELKMPRLEKKEKAPTMWNKNKPGGWAAYTKKSAEMAKKMNVIVDDDDLEVEMIMEKLDKMQDKLKHATLGKSKMKMSKREAKPEKTSETADDEEQATVLKRKESERMEEQIKMITSSKLGRTGQIFKMRDVVVGAKKSGPEAVAVVDSRSGELVVASSQIKKATLEYVLDTLTNNKPTEKFEELAKAKRKLHELKMKETDGDYEVTEEIFWKVIDKLESKKKKTYEFLTKASKAFKEVFFKFCLRMHLEEKFPSRFDQTVLVQLYKHKGPLHAFSSHRYLHIKEWAARLMESLEVQGMRDTILDAGTKFQLGGKPGMRVQFHLFVIKSVIAIKETLKEGLLIYGVDFQRFFDSEVLVDCMDTLGLIKIDPRIYRNWYRLNQRCLVSVVTGAGMTEEGNAGEVLGQGSAGGGLVSQLKVDLGVDSYFSGSSDEECYGGVRLQPMSWQDDVVGLAGEVRLAQASLGRLSYFVQESQLQVHPDKSTYSVFGSQKIKKIMRKEIEEQPLKIGDVQIKESITLTYLGDILHSDGLEASVEATVDERIAKIKGSIFELKALCEDFRMQICGGMRGAIDIFEACICTKLLANCGVWTKISEQAVKKLDAIQNLFVQVLLRLPSSTPLPAYRAETAMLGMKWRVWEAKLLLVEAIRGQEGDVLCREIFEQQLEMGWPGLAQEVTKISKELGLPNVCMTDVNIEDIKEAIRINHHDDLKKSLKGKLAHLKNEDLRKIQPYMENKCLEFCRMAFRLRTHQFICRKNMPKMYGGVLWCHSCSSGPEDGPGGVAAPEESQAHLEQCVAYICLRVGRDVALNFEHKVQYFMELSVERAKKGWC